MKFGKRVKNQYKRAAKDLGYPEEVIEKIEAAESEEEISGIMADARVKYLKD